MTMNPQTPFYIDRAREMLEAGKVGAARGLMRMALTDLERLRRPETALNIVGGGLCQNGPRSIPSPLQTSRGA